MGDLRARDVTQPGGPISGEHFAFGQWEWLSLVTSRAREVTGPAAEAVFWSALDLILDEVYILVNMNIMIFYIYFINKWTYVSIPGPFSLFII